jgi:phosphoesterase RecJ-like protein
MSFEYVSNASIGELAAAIRGSRRVLVTSHAKPDGDALGSVVAVVRCCRAIGVEAEGWLVGPFEPNLLSFAGDDAVVRVDPKSPRLPGEGFDLVAIVDTGAWSQLETLAPWLRTRVETAIGLDHHARGDRVAARRVVDVAWGSTTGLLSELVAALGVDLASGGDSRGRGSVAEALWLGLATDTGFFRFPNAREREFALAARLIAAGVDTNRVIALIEQSNRPERLAIEARALASVGYLADGAVATMAISRRDLDETGARPEELSGVVQLPMCVGAVRAVVFAVETEPGLVKLSFRSKPRDDSGRMLDVNELAARFGGGGHVHAAGARIKDSLDGALRQVAEAIRSYSGIL